jgi:hypothetical protein
MVKRFTCDLCGAKSAWFSRNWKEMAVDGYSYHFCATCGGAFEHVQHYMRNTLSLDVQIKDLVIEEEE